MIIILSLFSVFASILLNSPLYAVVGTLALAAQLYILKKDLALIDEGVTSLSQGDPHPLLPQTVEANTDSGREVLDKLFGLSFRVSALEVEIPESTTTKEVLKQDVRVDDFSLDDFFVELLSFIRSKFRCSSAAITYKSSPISDWATVGNGISGDRFTSRMKQVASSIDSTDSGAFGLRDGYNEESLVSEFSIFGLRYSILFPFSEKNELGARGILWLGYDETKVPTNAEIQSAQAIGNFITLQLTTKSKVSDLHRELKKIQIDAKQKTRFVADLSHDVRTPLNNVKNILALIKFEESAPDTNRMLEVAMDNCDHMADIVEDLLFYSQYHVGELRSNPKVLDIDSVLDRTVASFEASAKIKELKLIYEKSTDKIKVNVDAKHLRRIVSNLLSNAIKYTKKGQIKVSVKSENPDDCSIIITDTGVGLGSEEVSQLFTPFTRFDKNGNDGVGLGLALSKILANLNGGVIIANSEEGRGSTFELRLSRTKDKSSLLSTEVANRTVNRPTNRSAKPPVPNFQNYKILLVDDDLDYLESTKRLLSLVTKEVILATNGIEASGIIKMDMPDLVITDGDMPGGGGEAVCEAAESVGIPALVVSGREITALRESLKNHKVEHIFAKPADPELLIGKVKEILAASGK